MPCSLPIQHVQQLCNEPGTASSSKQIAINISLGSDFDSFLETIAVKPMLVHRYQT